MVTYQVMRHIEFKKKHKREVYVGGGGGRVFLILQETMFQDQVLKSSSLSKKQAEKVQVH